MMHANSFHVRSPIPEAQKLAGEKKARSLESSILLRMEANPWTWFTEYDFDDGRTLSTSIRRALSNLKKKEFIIACKPSEKPVGKYGVSINRYCYNIARHHSQQEEIWPKQS